MEKGIGLYIGKKFVAAASLAFIKGIPELLEFAVEPIVEDEKRKRSGPKELPPDVLAIEAALGKVGARKNPVVAAFNPFHLVTRYFEMPVLPRQEWPEAVPFEARRYIPFKLEEVFINYHVHGEKKKENNHLLSVTVTSVRKETLRLFVNHIRKAGASLKEIEPVFSSLSRALKVGQTIDHQKVYGFILIDSDGSVNVTLTAGGIVYLSRDFILSDDAITNQSRFYQEIKASLDFVVQNIGAAGTLKMYLAGSGDLQFWANYLTSVFDKEAFFETGTFPIRKDIPQNIASQLLVPIGLALRGLKRKSPLWDFSLLPAEERETKREKIKKVVGIEFLIVAFFFILLRIAILEPYAAHVRIKTISQLTPEAASDPALAVQAVDALQKIQAKMQSQIQQLKGARGEKSTIGKTLVALTKLLSESMWFDQINYRDSSQRDVSTGAGEIGGPQIGSKRTLELFGYCYLGDPEREVQEINKWVSEALAQDKQFMGIFKALTLEEVRRQQVGGFDATRFKIICR